MKTIATALDFSKITPFVYEKAVNLAKAFNSELYLFHVVHSLSDVYVGVSLANQEYYGSMGPLYIPDESLLDQLQQQAQIEKNELQRLQEKAQNQGIRCTGILLQGDTQKTLAKEICKIKPELLVIGSHGHTALMKVFLGSTSEYLMTHVKCPTLVIPRCLIDQSSCDDCLVE
jgi:nucleotide-binding universal stress UspA family protein